MSSLVDLPELVGFFSYSRRDDEHSQGALSRLRSRIHSELRLQLGRDFRLWQDTAAIPEGALWEDEIRRAIAESVFFVPIVTPSAVGSGHCRFEFGSFLKRETELGRTDLIFPLLYVTVEALEREEQWRRDEVLKIIGTRQYLDWRAFRFHDFSSAEVGQKVEQFCRNISRALRKTWVSPDERRAQEAADAERRAEEERRAQEAADARRRAEEARRRQEEERRREADVERLARQAEARQRAEAIAQSKREAEARARQVAEEERERTTVGQGPEAQGQERRDGEAQSDASGQSAWSAASVPSVGSSRTAILRLVLMPWKPVETLDQAHTLKMIGVVGLALCGVFFVVAALFGPGGWMVAAVLFALAAVGTHRDYRWAAIIGVAMSAVLFILLVPLLLLPATIAGIRGTAAIAKFRRAP